MLLHSSSHISSVKTKIQAQYLIDSEIYTLLPGGQAETAAKDQLQRAHVNIKISRAAVRKIMTEVM